MSKNQGRSRKAIRSRLGLPDGAVWSLQCKGIGEWKGKGLRGKGTHKGCTMRGCHCECHRRDWGHLRLMEKVGSRTMARVKCRDCGFGVTDVFSRHALTRIRQLSERGWVNLGFVPGISHLSQMPAYGGRRGMWLCPKCSLEWESPGEESPPVPGGNRANVAGESNTQQLIEEELSKPMGGE